MSPCTYAQPASMYARSSTFSFAAPTFQRLKYAPQRNTTAAAISSASRRCPADRDKRRRPCAATDGDSEGVTTAGLVRECVVNERSFIRRTGAQGDHDGDSSRGRGRDYAAVSATKRIWGSPQWQVCKSSDPVSPRTSRVELPNLATSRKSETT